MTGIPPQFQGWWRITETAADPATLVVHDMLAPAERFALMLHDTFGLALDDIAATPPAAHVDVDLHRTRARLARSGS